MPDEFSIIERYFNWPGHDHAVSKGVGDDAAILEPIAGQQLLVSTDTFIEGVHFPEGTSPEAVGHKALAVNLSDLAAMGADPAWFTLALTLSGIEPDWLAAFSAGMRKLAEEAGIALVGGDTTQGKLSVTITVIGQAEPRQVLCRDAARDGDQIYITGYTGLAAAGLAVLEGRVSLSRAMAEACVRALEYPKPRLAAARLIRQFGTSCIDISDGLLADLGHVMQASQLGAVLDRRNFPLAEELAGLPEEQALGFALHGGDDYELLFSVPGLRREAFETAGKAAGLKVLPIGRMSASVQGVVDTSGQALQVSGYRHFC